MSLPECPTVVIVGRPNVGKSTLFNRITRSRRAIVGNESGITRDRIRLEAEWKGRPFELIDTGGMMFGETAEFSVLVSGQVRVAIESAARLIFVVDGRSEISETDRDLADLLRRTNKPVSLAVNKCDTPERQALAAGFYELGFRDVFSVSAEHDLGVDVLLDHVTESFPMLEVSEAQERPIRVAIIGRPNVGKSTLLNCLTGKQRSIVSPTPGTTRDAVDEEIERGGVCFQFVDTAGIRRRGKTAEMTEKLSVVMAQRHIRLADVVLTLVDAAEGATALDAKIASYAHAGGRAMVIIVNKWDQAPAAKSRKAARSAFTLEVRDHMKYLDYAPVLFASALTGQGVGEIFGAVRKAYLAAHRRVTTGQLNRFLGEVDFDRVTAPRFQKPVIRYVTQASVAPPTFVFFTSRAKKFHFSYERFLINQVRRSFDFEGTPVVIKSKSAKR